MKKTRTALSVRARRRNKPMTYRTLEPRQLLASDVFSATTLQVCDLPDRMIESRMIETVAHVDNAAATDSAFAEFESSNATGVEPRQNPVGVSEVVIENGTDSRSIVQNIALIFDGIVNPQADAIELIQRESGSAVDLEVTVDNSSGVSRVTLTFSGVLATDIGSLVDGNYQLNVAGELLGSSSGGIDFEFGDQENDNLFRFYGDSNSDRNVNVFDLLGFRSTYRLSQDDLRFDSQFDANADGTINVFDLLNFRSNYRKNLSFV